MFSKVHSDKNRFLEQARAAREERAQEKQREEAAICIQVRAVTFADKTNFHIKQTFFHTQLIIICLPCQINFLLLMQQRS